MSKLFKEIEKVDKCVTSIVMDLLRLIRNKELEIAKLNKAVALPENVKKGAMESHLKILKKLQCKLKNVTDKPCATCPPDTKLNFL